LCGVGARRSVFLLDGQERWCISMSSLLWWGRWINERMLESQNEWAGPGRWPHFILNSAGLLALPLASLRSWLNEQAWLA